MKRIFITGSSDGLGQLAAKQLVNEGHKVVLHARNDGRGKDAMNAVPEAEGVLIADLSSMDETKQLATSVNELGKFDVIIHNAGVYQAPSELIINVNILAPYILTCMINQPQRLIYLSSGLHSGGEPKFKKLAESSADINYSDSKLHVVLLTKAVARLWPDVYSNAVDPGWVPTKMGGAAATDNLDKGYQTQCWLATNDNTEARVSGGYFYHEQQRSYHSAADDVNFQDEFLRVCEQLTEVKFPG